MQSNNKSINRLFSFLFNLPLIRRNEASSMQSDPNRINLKAFADHLDKQWQELKKKEEIKNELEQAKTNYYKLLGGRLF